MLTDKWKYARRNSRERLGAFIEKNKNEKDRETIKIVDHSKKQLAAINLNRRDNSMIGRLKKRIRDKNIQEAAAASDDENDAKYAKTMTAINKIKGIMDKKKRKKMDAEEERMKEVTDIDGSNGEMVENNGDGHMNESWEESSAMSEKATKRQTAQLGKKKSEMILLKAAYEKEMTENGNVEDTKAAVIMMEKGIKMLEAVLDNDKRRIDIKVKI